MGRSRSRSRSRSRAQEARIRAFKEKLAQLEAKRQEVKELALELQEMHERDHGILGTDIDKLRETGGSESSKGSKESKPKG
jgi:hypothetical protein